MYSDTHICTLKVPMLRSFKVAVTLNPERGHCSILTASQAPNGDSRPCAGYPSTTEDRRGWVKLHLPALGFGIQGSGCRVEVSEFSV